jgi:hypothetical protein
MNWALVRSSDCAAISTSPIAAGETRPVAEWVGKAGRARKLRDAKVTATDGYRVGAVVCVHGPGDEGTLVPGRQRRRGADRHARQPLRQALDHRAKFSRYPSFRDTKDLRFGMGLGATRIGEPARRDRLLLINAFAIALLTMLGAAGESLGMDRLLKSNTAKTRTHSLFRQGCMLYELIPTMPEHRLSPLMARFADNVLGCKSFNGIFSVV